MLKTAVIILNWNNLGYLKKFLGTVVKFSASEETKVYVADNGSTDGSVEWVLNNHNSAQTIKLDRNYGFAGGYSIALEKIDAEYFVLLNSDVEVTPNWLVPLITYMDQNPDVASCMPRIRSWHKRDYFEYAGAAGGFIDKYGYPFCRGRVFDNIEKDFDQYNDNVDVFWASGACMVVRSSAWKDCGGFDKDFFAHMEEIDLCWRFARRGYRVSVVPASVVFHVGGGALAYDSPFKTYLNFRNNLFLLHKNLKDEDFRKIMLIRKLLDSVAAIMFLLKGKGRSFRSVLKAHSDYNKNIPSLHKKRNELSLDDLPGYSMHVLNKSIVYEYFVKGNKTFKSLKMNN
ncbi:MAG TPA: glycosyltransferase family 2 protein [Bacteroidales bacterium]|nr:glycosyltransferase family 2 protein [Bacteroidales bacterium]